MSTNCLQSVTPILAEDKCKGVQTSTDCLIHEGAITYLNLPPNSTITVILQALLLSLVDARNRITVLETLSADYEIRITALENA
jgi:hypothetical protein